MKKITAAMVLAFAFFSPLFALEQTLIDFTKLSVADNDEGTQNMGTYVDFRKNAGLGYTDDELNQMNSSLYVPNWGVFLSSSSDFVANKKLSQVKIAPVVGGPDGSRRFGGENVMGIRASYPSGNFNSYAMLKPPFRIPGYNRIPRIGTSFTEGNGLIENVSTIKAVKVNVAGRQYPIKMIVVLRDNDYNRIFVDMGFLDFKSWSLREWRNPSYIADVRKRKIVKKPLYPSNDERTSTLALDEVIFFRDANFGHVENFIGYIKDISVIHDLAVAPDSLTDIEDEDLWGIVNEREDARVELENRVLGSRQILEFIEKARIDTTEEPVGDANYVPSLDEQGVEPTAPADAPAAAPAPVEPAPADAPAVQ